MSLAPEPVLMEVSPEGVAVITLNRPAKRNAMDEWLIQQLSETLETLKGADHVRIVFLRGEGESFCAGADIDWMRRQGERAKEDNEADAYLMARMFKHLHDLPQFTVALVHGAATGGGLGLIAACDWTVAMRATKFRFSEVRIGLMPSTITPFVVEAIGPRAARGLCASALPFDAEAAQRYGLVDDIVEDVPGMEGAMKRLIGLALENAPGAVAEAKALVRFAAAHENDDRTAKETSRRIAQQRASDEGREGLAAFVEKRASSWQS